MESELQLGLNVRYLVDDIKVLSRAALAERIGVSEAAIGQLIRGETKGLRPLNLVKAARALSYTVESLVTEDLAFQGVREERAKPYNVTVKVPDSEIEIAVQLLLAAESSLAHRVAKAIRALLSPD